MAFKNNPSQILIALAIFAMLFVACNSAGKNDTGDSYTWDMMYSNAFETYYLNPILPDSVGAIMPVSGTVPYVADATKRDIMLPYEIPNTPEGYELAGQTIKSPLDQSDPKVLAQGKHFFEIYCTPCHGYAGDGQGWIVTQHKYNAAPPSYFADGYLNMPDGKIFHSITYGKGQMQSYAQQVNKLERWEIIAYINALQEAYVAKNPKMMAAADSSAIK